MVRVPVRVQPCVIACVSVRARAFLCVYLCVLCICTSPRAVAIMMHPCLARRFHDMDELPFADGFKLVWRVGDLDDPVSGHKCFIENPKDGRVVGSPTASNVTAYGFAYVWDE